MKQEFFAPEFGNAALYHHLRDEHDIRGVCGLQVDNSVDETRKGVVTEIPEGAQNCQDCIDILAQEAEAEENGSTGEHQAADGEGTPGTDGEDSQSIGSEDVESLGSILEKSDARRTSRSAAPVEDGE